MASGPSQFVPNTNPLSVAGPLRYIDSNGNLVTQLFLVDYTTLIGNTVGTQVTQIGTINNILTAYATTLASLQTQITAIQTSGATFIPYVNGGCLNGNASAQVQTVTTLLVTNACSYNTILGTPTALAQAVVAQPSGLNTLPAFSQSGTMSGLAGWKSAPTTIADSENNQWIAYGDARAGIATALAAVTPTCAQVIINYQAVMNNFYAGMYVYFNGYTFIPTGYIDAGSSIQVTDGHGGILLQSINIVTLSTATSPLILNTSGSTLSATATTYTVKVTSKVTNAVLGTNCQQELSQIVFTGTIPGSTCCPDIGTFSLAVTSGSTVIAATYTLISGLTYLPRFVGITQTSIIIGTLPFQLLTVTPTLGGATLNVAASATGVAGFSGTFSVMWAAYR